ncbi:MAG: prephenate dehydrogenase/arogenate dehydrogenase family protein [Planctomycetales bacterium]|nr:prephenate dehydrogenase/arogenate dehydrogenase family protein [Planctomycetales bacterium]
MMTWDTVAIVGVGLIGGSIGRALLERGLARRVVGIGRRESTLAVAREVGAVSETTTDLAAGVAEARLIVIGTPVELVAGHACEAARHAPDGALITDVGSTKQAIVEGVARLVEQGHFAGARFVGSHPLAGSEKAGAAFSQSDLFEDRTVAVTPAGFNADEEIDAVERFWRSLGANVLRMTAAEHDEAVAASSHLPHLAASAVAAATPAECLPLAASGWAGTTRVAAGDPELWRQILSENRRHVLNALARLQQELAAYQRALESNDQTTLLQLLEAGKQRRDSVGS